MRRHAESTKNVANNFHFHLFETRKQSEHNVDEPAQNLTHNPGLSGFAMQVGERNLEDFQDAESSAGPWRPPMSRTRTRMIVEGKSQIREMNESVSTQRQI